MQPHQDRVLNEQHELATKINKLELFFENDLFAQLPKAEQRRLRFQVAYMNAYNDILKQRIDAFEVA